LKFVRLHQYVILLTYFCICQGQLWRKPQEKFAQTDAHRQRYRQWSVEGLLEQATSIRHLAW
jgi:hypothetical protein